MKLFVGITDGSWFRFLRDRRPDEVNFWRPLARTEFQALEPGEPFLFKLHYPQNYIVGGGFFVRYARVPLSVAWDAFGEKNGALSLETFRDDIHRYREKRRLEFEPNPNVGCIILADPFFFDEADWVAAPADWSSNIVQGKTYNTQEPEGRRIWQQVQDGLLRYRSEGLMPESIADERARYGSESLIRPRLGQGWFRIAVTDAYGRRCAITGERTLPVLQASHIKPYAHDGPHRIDNGLLLRADLHILFDRGYLTINHKLEVEVSQRIHSEFENGQEYYAMRGKRLLIVPPVPEDRPAREFIDWHNQNVFVP